MGKYELEFLKLFKEFIICFPFQVCTYCDIDFHFLCRCHLQSSVRQPGPAARPAWGASGNINVLGNKTHLSNAAAVPTTAEGERDSSVTRPRGEMDTLCLLETEYIFSLR